MLTTFLIASIFGIFSAIYVPIYICLIVMSLNIIYLIVKKKEYLLFFTIISFFCSFFLYAQYIINIKKNHYQIISSHNKNIEIIGKVKNVYNYGFQLKIHKHSELKNITLLIFAKEHNLYPGDQIKVVGNVKNQELKSNKEYLIKPVGIVFPRQIQVIKQGRLKNIYVIKKKLINNVKNILPEYYAHFLIGLLIGTDGIELDAELIDIFMNLGLLHMLVVSGAQVAIISGLLLKALNIFNLPKSINLLIILIFNSVFLLFTGNTVSVLRAIIMMQITVFLNYDNRDKTSLQVLSLTGIAMLIYSPSYLFHLGFIFSYSATFALIEISPKIKEILENKEYIPNIIKEPLAISLGPVLITSPIIFLINNRLDSLALLANIILAPIKQIIVIIGFSGMVFTFLIPFLANVLLKISLGLMVIMKLIAEILYSFPLRSIYFKNTFLINVIAFYIFFFIFFYKKNLFIKFKYYWIVFIITLILINIYLLNAQPEKEVYLYNKKDWFGVLYIDKKTHLLLTNFYENNNIRYFINQTTKAPPSIIISIKKDDSNETFYLNENILLKLTNNTNLKREDETISLENNQFILNILLSKRIENEIKNISYMPFINKLSKEKIIQENFDIIIYSGKESFFNIFSNNNKIMHIGEKNNKIIIYKK
jgi:competence protein ComEC